MAMRRQTSSLKTLCAILLLIILVLTTLPLTASARTEKNFSSGQNFADMTFSSANPDRTTGITLPARAKIDTATLKMEPVKDSSGHFPKDLSIDIGNDGIVDWRYSGPGLGEFGRQETFSDNSVSAYLEFTTPGSKDNVSVTLPVPPPGSKVTAASMNLKGSPRGGSWWNRDWMYRLPIWLNETNGKIVEKVIADVWINVVGLHVKSVNEFRVVSVDATGVETERKVQVVDERMTDGLITDARVIFDAPTIDGNVHQLFYVYLGNSGVAKSSKWTDFHPLDIKNKFANNLTERKDPAVSTGTFNKPAAIWVDSNGDMYIADTKNHVVSVYDYSGKFLREMGTKGIAGDDATHLSSPSGVLIDTTSYVLISDTANDRIQVFDKMGNFKQSITGGPDLVDGKNLTGPMGLAMNDTNIFCAVKGHHVVYFFDTSYVYNDSYFYPNMSGSDTKDFFEPNDVAIDPTTNELYIADTNNHRIQVLSNANPRDYKATIGGPGGGDGQFVGPSGVSVLDGRLYVADPGNHRVEVFSGGAYVSQFGEPGKSGSDSMHLNAPADVLARSGVIYIVDTGNNRIVRVFSLNVSVAAPDSLYPMDIAIDFGNDGLPEVTHPGGLTCATWTDDFSSRLDVAVHNDTLPSVLDTHSGMTLVTVPLNVSTKNAGGVTIFDLWIEYEIYSILNCTSAMKAYLLNASGSSGTVEVPISLHSTSGRLRMSSLDVVYLMPPELLAGGVPTTWAMPEGTNRTFEIYPYLKDDNDDPRELTYNLIKAEGGNVAMSVSTDGNMTIDASVDPNWNGIVSVQASVNNSVGLTTVLPTINVTVTPVNDAPIVTSIPPGSVVEGQDYVYDMTASDPEGDAITFTVNTAPQGLTVDKNTGAMRWTPGNDAVGSNKVIIEVSDGMPNGNFNYVLYINVSNLNDPPMFESTPPVEVNAGDRMVYPVIVSDPDKGDQLSMSLKGPDGMHLTGSDRNYSVEWEPGKKQAGKHAVTLTLYDGNISVEQAFNITVVGGSEEGIMGFTAGSFYLIAGLAIILIVVIVVIIVATRSRRKDRGAKKWRGEEDSEERAEVEGDRVGEEEGDEVSGGYDGEDQGTPGSGTCPSCGAGLEPDLDYCIQCGARVGEGPDDKVEKKTGIEDGKGVGKNDGKVAKGPATEGDKTEEKAVAAKDGKEPKKDTGSKEKEETPKKKPEEAPSKKEKKDKSLDDLMAELK